MRRFFIHPSTVQDGTAVISGTEANHIKNVLRLKPGGSVCLCDGQGREYHGKISGFSSEGVCVSGLSFLDSSPDPPVEITIAQGFLKDKKMDNLVRPLSELGVSRWVPFMAERSVARPDPGRLQERVQRWEMIARESLKQCRRTRLLEIYPALSFEEALDMGKGHDVKFIFWEGASDARISSRSSYSGNSIFAFLGPEGGFSEQEVALAGSAGFSPAGLGPRILRSETAAVAVSALLQFIFGDMGCGMDLDN
jgi:16S rRNA (uracil1498-N3)-methyltransferase